MWPIRRVIFPLLVTTVLLALTCSRQLPPEEQAIAPQALTTATIEYKIGVILVDYTPSRVWKKNPKYPEETKRTLNRSTNFDFQKSHVH